MSGSLRVLRSSSKPLYPVHFRRVLRPRASSAGDEVAIRDPLFVSSSVGAESRVSAEKQQFWAPSGLPESLFARVSATCNRVIARYSALFEGSSGGRLAVLRSAGCAARQEMTSTSGVAGRNAALRGARGLGQSLREGARDYAGRRRGG